MKTTRIAPTACPSCGVVHTAATNVQDASPRPKAFTICVECGALLQYGDNLQLVPPDDAAVIDVALQDPTTWALINKLQAYVKQRRTAKAS